MFMVGGAAISPVRAVAGLLALLLLPACVSYTRLFQDFEQETIGQRPLEMPPPNPPADNLVWNTQFATTTVQQDGAHRWAFTRAGGRLGMRENAQALLALSQPFATSGANIRGNLIMRMTGSGSIRIAFKAVPANGYDGYYLGGYSLTNDAVVPGSGVGYLQPGRLKSAIDDDSFVAWDDLGTSLASFSNQGGPVELFWSVDQQNRIAYLSANGQPSADIHYASGGIPIGRLMLMIYVRQFTPDTILRVDSMSVEELKK